jgi:conjugative transfer pilus assembly protein TraH
MKNWGNLFKKKRKHGRCPMFRKKVLKVLAGATACIFSMGVVGEAGWLDNWYQQSISSSPTYLKGQQRGYFTLGSFNARVDTETLYPISISMPRLKVGCGGIDIFWGGFSFLNFEYLVQKLQNMIQAAPYIAFQIALKTISQKLGSTLEAAEQVINALNSMQFNECQFLRGFTMKLIDTGDITAALEEGAIRAGIYPFWKKTSENVKPGGVDKTKSSDMIKGCPSEVQALLANFSGEGLLDNLAKDRGYRDPELIGLIRAAIGDMYLQYGDNGVPIITYIPPCGDFFADMQSKRTVRIRRSWNSQCEVYDLNQFVMRVRQDLLNLYNQIQGKGDAVVNVNTQLLDPKKVPLPVYLIVKTAIMARDPSLLEAAVEPIAYGYLTRAFAEMISVSYADVQEAYKKFMEAKRTNEEAQTKDPEAVCEVPEIQESYVQQMLENHHRAMQSMNAAFQGVLSQLNTLADIVGKYERFYEIAMKEVARKFGFSPASRIF